MGWDVYNLKQHTNSSFQTDCPVDLLAASFSRWSILCGSLCAYALRTNPLGWTAQMMDSTDDAMAQGEATESLLHLESSSQESRSYLWIKQQGLLLIPRVLCAD